VQDEHPALPENVTEDMQGFLLECFQKDPQKRPDARALLRHAWLRQQRATLRSTWSNTVKARGERTDAHASVTNVVERILQVSVTVSFIKCLDGRHCVSPKGLQCSGSLPYLLISPRLIWRPATYCTKGTKLHCLP